MGARRMGRERALQMLYAMDVADVDAEAEIALYWAHLAEEGSGNHGFADDLVRAYGRRSEHIDGMIREVSHHWRLERMARVDRNVLRLATAELLDMDDVPRRVTLNEAVELAKRFGSEGSAGFVNGILDRIASDLGKD
ncbi:MAG: transcription antitermination factor NusB [Deltaproteobacteria bacterium]|nr:transcription antitermination factor NusB [Deltaproteobacteria bacterium]